MVTLEMTEKEVHILHALVCFEYERLSEIADQSESDGLEVSSEAMEYVDNCAYLARRLETEVKRI